ncbi:Serine--tRNA ligase, mitochondrial [Vanrija pseudolonga]|uniref:serine--tRNA ligase n=1 Tax=Vanrija pseudolonga TaxID=143232 RepID=A0AAF1BJL2_9TREE|nr:Serine--tRNA ligase, mitochondrial [Vanrija pseudolonga]
MRGLTALRASACRRPVARALSTSARASAPLAKPRIDYARFLSDPEATSRNIVERALPLAADHVERLRAAREAQLGAEHSLNDARAAQGVASAVLKDKSKTGAEKQVAIAHAKLLKDEVQKLEAAHAEAERALLELALVLPNFSHPATPIGAEENATLLESFGPAPLPTSEARDHVRVTEAYRWLDPAASATTTGSSWPFLLGATAQLEHALSGYALSTAIKHGYTPVSPPEVISADVAWRCGFQPRDGDNGPRQTYFLESEHGDHAHKQLCLAGTAEIPLAAMNAGRTLAHAQLPVRYVGVGRAFRAEAGARGADTRGLYRVHQFTKVELFAITASGGGKSDAVMEEIRGIQKEIAEGLGLSVRVLDMPTSELGASASRKYDMEAWMPGRGKWGEITSTSNCTDYQARRLGIRYKDGDGLHFAHTLNGTGAAVPRLIVALLENGVRLGAEGQVEGVDLPQVLRAFWLGPEKDGDGDVIRWV